jgi:uncharacterized protein YyaL (SSP411 family)
MANRPNRLINEKSPYLLQHAHNPVDWFPWGAEAFERARKDNKPIFLSIGYSTCHWCHVMEHESFEDDQVAALMNDTFVSIKVDREERPDLDHVYMTVCQMVTGGGGWPLTIVMTPDKKPFFAGTYIPKTSRLGRIGMIELIPKIKELWASRYNEVAESAEKIMEALQGMTDRVPGEKMGSSILDKAYHELAGRFDKEHGGFGNAPKFPTAHNLLFLLRYWNRTGNEQSLQMVEKTLRKMRKGGIYDHIGFGFHRYSTDREWLLPHFEKMLYDQALLVIPYLEAYQATGTKEYGQTGKEILDYVLRDMTSPQGGFYSAEDADSEGEEGKFYVWEEKEIVKILGKDEAAIIARVFNIKENGNFKDESSGKNTGTNIFHIRETISDIATYLKIASDELEHKISSACKQLFEKRDKRIHPHKDDKILTDWNGLMIAALSRGAQLFENGEYQSAALKAGDFILNSLRGSDGRLLHRYRDGSAGITGNLDDFAFLVWGLIELYETVFDSYWLKTALDLNQDMISRFWDKNKGGLFFTPEDGEELIIRKKEIYDGALPSGNSVAMLNLLRLARITGRSDLEEMASQILQAFSSEVKQLPSAFTYFLTAVDFSIGPSYEVVIAGNSENDDTQAMIKALRSKFIPNRVTILRPTQKSDPGIDRLASFVKSHVTIDGRATAYVCINNACKAPTTDVISMLESVGIFAE